MFTDISVSESNRTDHGEAGTTTTKGNYPSTINSIKRPLTSKSKSKSTSSLSLSLHHTLHQTLHHQENQNINHEICLSTQIPRTRLPLQLQQSKTKNLSPLKKNSQPSKLISSNPKTSSPSAVLASALHQEFPLSEVPEAIGGITMQSP